MSNYSNSLYNDYLTVVERNKKLEEEVKFQKLRADIAEDEQFRLEKIVAKKRARNYC